MSFWDVRHVRALQKIGPALSCQDVGTGRGTCDESFVRVAVASLLLCDIANNSGSKVKQDADIRNSTDPHDNAPQEALNTIANKAVVLSLICPDQCKPFVLLLLVLRPSYPVRILACGHELASALFPSQASAP